jgi:hypothetical protein
MANQEGRDTLSQTKRIVRAARLPLVAVATTGFLAGFAVCRYQVYTGAAARRTALAVDARFRAPEVRLRPGYYWVAAPRAPIWVDIATTKSGALRKISLLRAAPRGHLTFTFDYFPDSRFGVPQAWLMTGRIGAPHLQCWFNVGLRHQFLIKSWPHHGRPRTKINGRWVKFRGGPGNTIRSDGREYRYQKATGGWVPVSTPSPPFVKNSSGEKEANLRK